MEPTQKTQSASILVVDDNEANRALARHTLEDEGYRVVLADSGRAGIAAFEAELPDCILLDVRMPELDGFAVCERIRGLPNGESTPVIFLTALRDVETFDRALRAGGDDFLTKPVRPTELVVRVQSALKLRQMRDELREHYALLKQQRDDMMRMQLQKERLTAFVVHDLKNPVNAMDLHAQLLFRDKDLSQSARDSVQQIRAEARHLNRMILNLLDVSKSDEGKLSPNRTKVDLPGLMTTITTELDANARSRQVGIRASLAVSHLHADEDLLRRALTNLIENALRHSPAQTTVILTSERIDDATELHVRDHGNGVTPEMRETIFDPFVQIATTDAAATRAGRGLGLTFCKLVAEAHGGTIDVEDAAPGAIFIMRFPGE